MTAALSASRRWLALGVVCLAGVMVVLDVTIVHIALPSVCAFAAAALGALFLPARAAGADREMPNAAEPAL